MAQHGHRIFAALYDRMNGAAERGFVAPRRAALLGGLTGEVLDVGAGTGANLPHLRRASRVVAAEPDPAMRRRLLARAGRAEAPIQVDDASAEALPYPDASFDAVVFTLVLCTVADPDRALAQARRVLRSAGRLIVLEHVRGTAGHARWQGRITPLWKRVGAGCHPGRDTRAAIERAGFTFVEVEQFQPMPRWIPVSTWLQGTATPPR